MVSLEQIFGFIEHWGAYLITAIVLCTFFTWERGFSRRTTFLVASFSGFAIQALVVLAALKQHGMSVDFAISCFFASVAGFLPMWVPFLTFIFFISRASSGGLELTDRSAGLLAINLAAYPLMVLLVQHKPLEKL